MQHVLNIAFDFDDEKVRTIVEKAIEQDMDSIIKEIILDRIAPHEYSYFNNKKERQWSKFEEMLDGRIDAILEEHKEEIIDRASTKLVESYKRTKAWKERSERELDAAT